MRTIIMTAMFLGIMFGASKVSMDAWSLITGGVLTIFGLRLFTHHSGRFYMFFIASICIGLGAHYFFHTSLNQTIIDVALACAAAAFLGTFGFGQMFWRTNDPEADAETAKIGFIPMLLVYPVFTAVVGAIGGLLGNLFGRVF
ncbi:MAG: hypothetical protein HQK58_13385 [Deltaproteobacteria bacterium]|nr:hypothetical protein [Deltaproteobacteria bacterium]